MRIIGSSAMSRDVLCRVSGPALGWRNRLSRRSGPVTSLLAQNRAKRGDSWPVARAGWSRPGRRGERSLRPGTWRRAGGAWSQSAIRVRQRESAKPRWQHVRGRGPARPRPEVAEQQPGEPVVGQDVEPGRDGVRRSWFEALHERVQPGAGRRGCTGVIFPAAGLVFGVAGECEQVLALVGIQPESIRDRGQHTGRGLGLAALLQPRVPGQADIGELGDLFPAQTRNPPYPQSASPTSAGLSRARRERRNAPCSRRRSRTAPRTGRPADRQGAAAMTSPESRTGCLAAK
jgi:hypothetical protein